MPFIEVRAVRETPPGIFHMVIPHFPLGIRLGINRSVEGGIDENKFTG